MFDERGSFSVAHPYPGPLAALLKSVGKVCCVCVHFSHHSLSSLRYSFLNLLSLQVPNRVALTGEIIPVKEKRVRLLSMDTSNSKT